MHGAGPTYSHIGWMEIEKCTGPKCPCFLNINQSVLTSERWNMAGNIKIVQVQLMYLKPIYELKAKFYLKSSEKYFGNFKLDTWQVKVGKLRKKNEKLSSFLSFPQTSKMLQKLLKVEKKNDDIFEVEYTFLFHLFVSFPYCLSFYECSLENNNFFYNAQTNILTCLLCKANPLLFFIMILNCLNRLNLLFLIIDGIEIFWNLHITQGFVKGEELFHFVTWLLHIVLIYRQRTN